MIRLIFTLILILTSFWLNAQNFIIGRIIDAENGKPLPYSTVYQNGTSNGTISNGEGEFRLDKLEYPCDVVISHVGYETKLIQQQDPSEEQYVVKLRAKAVQLQEVKVRDKNYRKRNLQLFRKLFLGSDKFGKAAYIKNEDSIQFRWEYSERKIRMSGNHSYAFLKRLKITRWSEDRTIAYYEVPSVMHVYCNSPVQVHSPLLGYDVHVDLVQFAYGKRSGYCQFLGYYFFQSKPNSGKEILENRKLAYFNSSQHFCRSLFQNKLGENGFQLFKREGDKATKINIDSYLHHSDKGVEVVGCNKKHFTIGYFYNYKGYPTDLTQKKGRRYVSSDIYFLSDTCFILSNGIIPNNSISFTAVIGTKGLGAALPADYQL
ncbi:carboxypeptidase-like regulatory domain-containing protein [Prolixibacteraceae bacterium JC049]|nr:carboxypeptidase-like regulatory domain-containing protein [Prolixibacteraceae bacterium JC049]